MKVAYDHIHFGVWADLERTPSDNGSQTIADLGIGFVQNYDGSGVTADQGFGKVEYNGDWVAAVRRQYASDAEKGAIQIHSDAAKLTADFAKDEFTGVLTNLATLTGKMTGNGFLGTKATLITHADLNSAGTFTGSFSGNIYGPDGDEAAGVFAFDGGENGAFTGAFGGTSQE